MHAGHRSIMFVAMTAGVFLKVSTSTALTAEPTHVAERQTSIAITVNSAEFVVDRTLSLGQVYAGLGCVGSNRSPSLTWTAVPRARSYAVALFDPDASGDGWWHWTVANIASSVISLAAGVGSRRGVLPDGAVQGQTDFGSVGYGGPCPPVGDKPHRYVLTVYALDTATLPVDASTSGATFKTLIEAHTLATGSITARFGR